MLYSTSYHFVLLPIISSLLSIKKLVKETAIYGLSSIVGRALFFLLTPLYTSVFSKGEYGRYADLYSIISFLLILLGYGMETAYFRYSLKENPDKKKAYSTALSSVVLTTIVVAAALLLFNQPLARLLQNANYSNLLRLAIIVVALDTITSIPFANLRANSRPIRFASIKLIGIAVNIAINLFFLYYCPRILESGPNHSLYDIVEQLYRPEFGIGYILVANIADSLVKLILLSPQLTAIRSGISSRMLKKMLTYGWPIMIVSFAGMINEVADRQLLKFLLPSKNGYNMEQLGIYAACYKLSIFLSLFTQAFRYAGEPFFFSKSNDSDAKQVYADVMKYFLIAALFGFLMITLYLDIFKHFIRREEYWTGLAAVPILLFAYVLYGAYYNLSVWYKLSDKTKLGAIVAIIGAVVTLIVNIVWIPKYGFMASAWATLLCFLVMVLVSYSWGKKHYSVPYEVGELALYCLVAIGLAIVLPKITNELSPALKHGIHFVGILIFLAFTIQRSGIRGKLSSYK